MARSAAIALVFLAYAQEARELTISGCLLSNGYAGYQVEDALNDLWEAGYKAAVRNLGIQQVWAWR